MELAQRSTANQILAGLAPDDFAALKPLLEPVDLPVRRRLETRGEPIEQVYFVESGIVSMVASGGTQHNIEIGIVGREGMTGIPVILGSDHPSYETFVQSAGSGWRLPANDLKQALIGSRTLTSTLQRYVSTVISQITFTALANGRFRLEERLARWLLMAADRTSGDVIKLTHEFLATMLGSRRAGVTVAINELERRGVILATRGTLTIVDRQALEETANGSYGFPEQEYQRLLGSSSRVET